MITATVVSQIALLIALGNPFMAKAEITWYDPALGGINCFMDCEFAGHRIPVQTSYGNVTACPLEFPRGTRFEIRGSGPHYSTGHLAWLADGVWECWDSGDDVILGYDSFVLDLMSKTPMWNEKLWIKVIPPAPKCYREYFYDMVRYPCG